MFARIASLFVTMTALALVAACSTSPAPRDDDPASSAARADAEQRARIRLQLAVGYYQQGQTQTALDELRQALQADPRMADAYSMRGLIYMDMGEDRQAEENFQQALKLVPNSPDYNNNYGWFLCQHGRAEQSIAYFERAVRDRTYRSPGKAYNNAGACSLKLGDFKAAERYFSQAFEHDPGNPTTSLHLAHLYYGQGAYERARFHVGRVMKAEVMTPDVLWLAIRTERKLGDRATENALAAQLRRLHPGSAEFAAYQRGAFDE